MKYTGTSMHKGELPIRILHKTRGFLMLYVFYITTTHRVIQYTRRECMTYTVTLTMNTIFEGQRKD